MRLPFLRPKTQAPEGRKRATPVAEDPASAGAARTRARRRLVGALVLLVIGVLGFPVLFETQPRPLPVDTPIELPRRDPTAAPPPVPTARPTPRPVPSVPADIGNEETPAVAAQAAAPLPLASAPPPSPVAAAAAAPAPRALAPVAAPAAGRFVVQVGAYSDPGKLRDARAKVEGLGMKTYTQVIEGDAGKRTRVRVGPFATRQEADAVAAKVKRSGLPVAVLAL